MEYDEGSELFLSLIRKKQEMLSNILAVTEQVTLGDDADSVDAYVSLINKRQLIFDQINVIEQKLNSPERVLLQQTQEHAVRMEADRIAAETRLVLNQLIALDLKHAVIADRIFNSIKKEIKGINNNKTINQYYRDDAYSSDGSYFDKKK